MKKLKIEAFHVIGISVRTTNENQQAAKDIPALWGRFMSEGIQAKIPNKIDAEVLSIYTNYEGDHTKPYDTILGCRVSSLDVVPEGMVAQSFEGGSYVEFVSKGDMNQGAVYNTWLEIWNADLDRKFTADFEVYGEKAKNPANIEVPIFVVVNE